jgi:hydrogenase nickel incorporation protein HypA/HybF
LLHSGRQTPKEHAKQLRVARPSADGFRDGLVEEAVHEVALAQAIWRQVLSEMERQEGRRLVAIDLVVGAWSGADPESLEFALGLLIAESGWPQARARIRREPLALVCRACGREFEAEDLNLVCPGCGGLDVDPVRGQQLLLESLEVE